MVFSVFEAYGHLDIPAEDVFAKGELVDADVLLRAVGGVVVLTEEAVAVYHLPPLLDVWVYGEIASDIVLEHAAVVCRREVVPVVAGGSLAAAHNVVERAKVGDFYFVP